MERHRLLWIFLSQRKLLDGVGKWFLHIAPEPCLFSRFEAAFGTGYVAADLMRGDVAVRMDIEKIPFADEQFDSIYCSHVLEHVVDDKAAMIEFHRVLRRSGWAILLVPITAAKTFENPTIVDPVQRRAVFGQEDHVRRYGPDYVHRLRDAGFIVEAYTATDIVGDTNARALMGLTAASGEIYFCRKS